MQDSPRLISLVRRCVRHFGLDLKGATVLTEAAGGAYACTCLAAALAGADVLAVARDTAWGRADDIAESIGRMADRLGVKDRISIISGTGDVNLSRVDIATNLGMVRPLNAGIIHAMKPGSALALMCESWEVRPGDVDLGAARDRGLAVFGTNEDHERIDVFSSVGAVAVKMILSLGREITGNTILVAGEDKFAGRSARALSSLGAAVVVADNDSWPSLLSPDIDAVLFADYTFGGMYIGEDGQVSCRVFAEKSPHACVAVLCGSVDGRGLNAAGIPCFPDVMTTPYRMVTFDYLGELPVVKLHTAGLKVAEISWRSWDTRAGRDENEKRIVLESLGMADPVDWSRQPGMPDS